MNLKLILSKNQLCFTDSLDDFFVSTLLLSSLSLIISSHLLAKYCKVSTREEHSHMVSNKQKVFIGQPVTKIYFQDPGTAICLPQDEVLSTRRT